MGRNSRSRYRNQRSRWSEIPRYATGATLYAATGRAVAVCFSAGNLQPVARALHMKFPELVLIVCADNDPTPGNPGLTHATQAARAVGGLVAVPRFEGLAHG